MFLRIFVFLRTFIPLKNFCNSFMTVYNRYSMIILLFQEFVCTVDSSSFNSLRSCSPQCMFSLFCVSTTFHFLKNVLVSFGCLFYYSTGSQRWLTLKFFFTPNFALFLHFSCFQSCN